MGPSRAYLEKVEGREIQLTPARSLLRHETSQPARGVRVLNETANWRIGVGVMRLLMQP